MATDSKPYLAYYQARIAKRYSQYAQNPYVRQYAGQLSGTDPSAYQNAADTLKRQSLLAESQGLGAKDLTDTVIQDAASRERRKRMLGRTRASTFLSPQQSLLAGGL